MLNNIEVGKDVKVIEEESWDWKRNGMSNSIYSFDFNDKANNVDTTINDEGGASSNEEPENKVMPQRNKILKKKL